MDFPESVRVYAFPDTPQEIDFCETARLLCNRLPSDEMDAMLPQSVHKESGAAPLNSLELATWLSFVNARRFLQDIDPDGQLEPDSRTAYAIEMFAGNQVLHLCELWSPTSPEPES